MAQQQDLEEFSPPDHFQVSHVLGRGAYGIVCAALDTRNTRDVAVKMIKLPENELFCTRIYREVMIMQQLHHENILEILDFSVDRARRHAYIVTPRMEATLKKVITDGLLTDEHRTFFSYMILRGLAYLHSAGIMHRDLRPENILVNCTTCDLKIADFGLSTIAPGHLSPYVVARWYRAPEITVNPSDYTTSVDMWAFGCIVAEMFLGRPLFPCRNAGDLITRILDMLGTPASEEELHWVNYPRAREQLLGRRKRERIPLDVMFPNAPKEALDLLSKVLVFDPTRRMTAAQGLSHPYVVHWHDPSDEPVEARFHPLVQLEGKTIDDLTEMLYDLENSFQAEPIAVDVAEMVLADSEEQGAPAAPAAPAEPVAPAPAPAPELVASAAGTEAVPEALGNIPAQMSTDSLEGVAPPAKVAKAVLAVSPVRGGFGGSPLSRTVSAPATLVNRTSSNRTRPSTPLTSATPYEPSSGITTTLIDDLQVEEEIGEITIDE